LVNPEDANAAIGHGARLSLPSGGAEARRWHELFAIEAGQR
jgi:hypothetical protein